MSMEHTDEEGRKIRIDRIGLLVVGWMCRAFNWNSALGFEWRFVSVSVSVSVSFEINGRTMKNDADRRRVGGIFHRWLDLPMPQCRGPFDYGSHA